MVSENSHIPTYHPGSTQDPGWYVLRYRVLSALLKEQLAKSPVEIFHKYRLVNVNHGKKNEVHEVPVLNGYVFVHAELNEVKALAQRLNLPIMLDIFRERCIHIPHRAMLPFMQAVKLKTGDLDLCDPKEIDPEKDDVVVFNSGELKGTWGYLKPGRGRNGGRVIVPLSLSDDREWTFSYDHPHKAPLCYSLQARQDELSVLAFAQGNRHAKDCILDAQPVVNAAFEQYRETKEVDEGLRQKLLAFVKRYGQARLNTSIQKAQHTALLFRIHVILGNTEEYEELRERISSTIVPELTRRRDAALKRGNPSAAAKQQELLNELEATKSCCLIPDEPEVPDEEIGQQQLADLIRRFSYQD